MQRYSSLAFIAITLSTAGAVAWASATAQNDALAAAQAQVSLTQAVAAAEQHAQGKAVKAEFEHAKQGPHYEIEVVSGTKVFDVRIDASTGAVLSSKQDHAD